jgi:hypothetical protein
MDVDTLAAAVAKKRSQRQTNELGLAVNTAANTLAHRIPAACQTGAHKLRRLAVERERSWDRSSVLRRRTLMIHLPRARLAKSLVAALSVSVIAACGGGSDAASTGAAQDNPAALVDEENGRENALIRGGGPIATRPWMASLQVGTSHTDAQGRLDRAPGAYRVCVGVQRLSDCSGAAVAGVTAIRVHPNWRGAVGDDDTSCSA